MYVNKKYIIQVHHHLQQKKFKKTSINNSIFYESYQIFFVDHKKINDFNQDKYFGAKIYYPGNTKYNTKKKVKYIKSKRRKLH